MISEHDDLIRIHDKLVKLGEDWADKKAASEMLEENRKSLRAQCALEYIGKAGSMGKAEMMAESDSKYINHLRLMVEANRATNKARVRYDTARVYVDLMRTREATRRTEIQTFKG